MAKAFEGCSPFPVKGERNPPPFRCWLCTGTYYVSETICLRDGNRTLVRECGSCKAQCKLAGKQWVNDSPTTTKGKT